MKKIIAGLAFMLTVGFVHAQDSTSATNQGTSYDYYPDENVYYNGATQTYWYRDSTANEWKSGTQLPSGYSINEKSTKNTFYYNGGDVWEKNAEHMKMYGKKGKDKKPSKE